MIMLMKMMMMTMTRREENEHQRVTSWNRENQQTQPTNGTETVNE